MAAPVTPNKITVWDVHFLRPAAEKRPAELAMVRILAGSFQSVLSQFSEHIGDLNSIREIRNTGVPIHLIEGMPPPHGTSTDPIAK